MRRMWKSLLLLGISVAPFVHAQEEGATQPKPSGTLPPVEVRPMTQPNSPMVDPSTDVSDPGAGISDDPTSNGLTDYFGGESYPALDAQILGRSSGDISGLNGLTRGEQSLFDLPQFGSIVDRRTLDERMASDMFRALQNETGVLLQQTGRGQLSPFIRGLTGQQILILVDGVRLNNSILRSGPNQYAATIDPGSIERIEVVRGAQSVMWGSDALGGAINIVTRGADPTRGDYMGTSLRQYFSTADSGSYTRGNVEGWLGNGGVFAGASYLGVHDLDRGGGLGRQPATDYDQYAADVKVHRWLTETSFLTVAFQHFDQHNLPRSDRFLPFVSQPRPDGGTSTQRPTSIDQQRDLAFVRWQGVAYNDNAFFDAYSATMSYSLTKEGQTDFRFANNNPATLPNRREDGEFRDDMVGVTVAASKDYEALGKLTYGVDYYYEDIDAYRRRSNNPNAPAPTFSFVEAQYPDDSRADRTGAFVNWNVDVTQQLSANAGLRYENVDLSSSPNITGVGVVPFDRNYNDWIASLGLTYALTDELRLVGGYYEGFRAPTIDDLVATKIALQNVQTEPRIGNLAINPEQTRTYETGVKWNGERLRLQAYEWWTHFDSYIGRETIAVNNVPTEFLSNQEAYLNGTEAYAEYLLNGGWSVYGNGAYTYGKITTNGQPFPRIPPLQGTVGLRWRDSARPRYFDIYTWLVDQVEQKHYNQFNLSDVRFIAGGTPGYGTLNLRAGTALGSQQNHKLSVALENITDQYYRVLGSGVDGAGFNAILGYEYVR